MDNTTATYKRSPIVTFGKGVLNVAQKILPKQVYGVFYKMVFGLYRWGIRTYYFRNWFLLKLQGKDREANKVQTVHRIMPYSLVGIGGLEVTYDAVDKVEVEQISGALVECGVARGGSAALMMLAVQQHGGKRHGWFFDSYEGLPDPTAQDFDERGATGHHARPLPKGSCLGTYEEVENLLLRKLELPAGQVHMVKGWFQDTLPATRDQIGSIAVLRLDGDWYESTKVCLEQLYDQVATGGYVIIDDYMSCYGSQRATDEFLQERGIQVDIKPDGRGGVFFKKPA